MKKYKIAIIGANKPLEPFYSQIDKSKFEVYSFAWAEGAVCSKYADEFYPISFTEKDEILEYCKKIGIDGITSFSLESAVPTVQYIASQLNLVVNEDKVVEWVGHKNILQKKLSEAGLVTPKSFSINSIKQLEDLSESEYPLIIKPADGGGSKGVNLVFDIQDAIKAYKYAIDNSRSKEVVAESYIDGEEYSVEYISCNGKHFFLSITDKKTSNSPHFIELQHKQPSNLLVNMQDKVKCCVEKALSVLGITNSPSHSEIRIDKHGNPCFIEIGPRLGGGYITSDLIKLSTGVDLVNLSLELCCGIFTPPVKKVKKTYAVLFYTPYTKEQVENLLTNQEVNIIYNNLEDYKDCCENNSQRSGCIIYSI